MADMTVDTSVKIDTREEKTKNSAQKAEEKPPEPVKLVSDSSKTENSDGFTKTADETPADEEKKDSTKGAKPAGGEEKKTPASAKNSKKMFSKDEQTILLKQQGIDVKKFEAKTDTKTGETFFQSGRRSDGSIQYYKVKDDGGITKLVSTVKKKNGKMTTQEKHLLVQTVPPDTPKHKAEKKEAETPDTLVLSRQDIQKPEKNEIPPANKPDVSESELEACSRINFTSLTRITGGKYFDVTEPVELAEPVKTEDSSETSEPDASKPADIDKPPKTDKPDAQPVKAEETPEIKDNEKPADTAKIIDKPAGELSAEEISSILDGAASRYDYSRETAAKQKKLDELIKGIKKGEIPERLLSESIKAYDDRQRNNGGETLLTQIQKDVDPFAGICTNPYLRSITDILKADCAKGGKAADDILYTAGLQDDKAKLRERELNVSAEFVSKMSDADKNVCTSTLDNLLSDAESALNAAIKKEGSIAYVWDGIKNKLGMQYGSQTIQSKINDLRQQIKDVKDGKLPLGYLYKQITGNELSEKELQNLKSGKFEFSNTVKDDAKGYEAGQKESVKTAAAITSLALAYASGGLGLLAAGAAAGTGYAAVEAADELGTDDGLTKDEAVRIAGEAVLQGGLTMLGGAAAKGAGALGKLLGFSDKTITYMSAHAGASILGAKSAGDYTLNQLLAGESIDPKKAIELLIQGEAAANLGAFTGVSSNMVLSPALTQGTTAPSQILGRLAAKGGAGVFSGSIAASGGETAAYLTRCAQGREEFSMEGLGAALVKNAPQGGISGFMFGVMFEAANIAKGMGRPEGTVNAESIKMENGIKLTRYTDKNGNVTCDISAKDLSPAQKQALGITDDMAARTVRFKLNPNIRMLDDTVIDLSKANEIIAHNWAGKNINLNIDLSRISPAERSAASEKPAAEKPAARQPQNPPLTPEQLRINKFLDDNPNVKTMFDNGLISPDDLQELASGRHADVLNYIDTAQINLKHPSSGNIRTEQDYIRGKIKDMISENKTYYQRQAALETQRQAEAQRLAAKLDAQKNMSPFERQMADQADRFLSYHSGIKSLRDAGILDTNSVNMYSQMTEDRIRSLNMLGEWYSQELLTADEVLHSLEEF